jgi:hypothetical protein
VCKIGLTSSLTLPMFNLLFRHMIFIVCDWRLQINKCIEHIERCFPNVLIRKPAETIRKSLSHSFCSFSYILGYFRFKNHFLSPHLLIIVVTSDVMPLVWHNPQVLTTAFMEAKWLIMEHHTTSIQSCTIRSTRKCINKKNYFSFQ